MYNISFIEDLLEEIAEIGATVFVGVAFSGLFALAIFILNGFAVYSISKRMNFNNPWISFIPFANIFALGRIGQKYIKRDGSKSAKFGPILLVFYIIQFIIEIAFLILLVLSLGTVIGNAYSSIEQDITMSLDMFYPLISVIAAYFVLFAIALTYKILYFVVLWRVYAILCNENATLFTVLSVLFEFLAPVFLFIYRNREPKFTFEERMNFPKPEFEFSEE